MENKEFGFFARRLKDTVGLAVLMGVYAALVYAPLFQWDWDNATVYEPADELRFVLAVLGPLMIQFVGATVYDSLCKKGYNVAAWLGTHAINAVFVQAMFLTIPGLPTSQIVALAICPTIAWVGMSLMITFFVRRIRAGEELTILDIGHWVWASSDDDKDKDTNTETASTTPRVVLAPNGLILAAPADFVPDEYDEMAEEEPVDPDLIPEEVRPEDIRVLSTQEYLEAISMGPTVAETEDFNDVAGHRQRPTPTTTAGHE